MSENPFIKKAPRYERGAGKRNRYANLTMPQRGVYKDFESPTVSFSTKTKSLIVEAASRGFIPPWTATLALRVLFLKGA